MQSGVINKDNFAQVFRGISQRRQQGTMEVHSKETIYKLQLIQGKIVEMSEAGVSPVHEVAEILKNAGFFEEPARRVGADEGGHVSAVEAQPAGNVQADEAARPGQYGSWADPGLGHGSPIALLVTRARGR